MVKMVILCVVLYLANVCGAFAQHTDKEPFEENYFAASDGFYVLSNESLNKTKPDVTKIYGKIKIVNNFPDYKVKIVRNFADLHVKLVDNFPDAPGKWKIVENFPDFKTQIVDNFPDFTIKYVDNFPGKP